MKVAVGTANGLNIFTKRHNFMSFIETSSPELCYTSATIADFDQPSRFSADILQYQLSQKHCLVFLGFIELILGFTPCLV